MSINEITDSCLRVLYASDGHFTITLHCKNNTYIIILLSIWTFFYRMLDNVETKTIVYEVKIRSKDVETKHIKNKNKEKW